MKKTPQKLELNRETIRTLHKAALSAVAGGLPPIGDGDVTVLTTKAREDVAL